MNILRRIRKGYCLSNLALTIIAVTVTNTFISCTNDDDKIPIYSLKDVEGYYIGSMQTAAIQAIASKNSQIEEKANAYAFITNNSLLINQFPVSDLIKSLITDPEDAEAIIKAVKEVQYKMPYQATFNDNKDIISLQFSAEPLVIEIPMESQSALKIEGAQEATSKLIVKVTIKAEQEGIYTYDTNTLKFTIQATKVTVNDTPFALPPTAFTFLMTKHPFLEL